MTESQLPIYYRVVKNAKTYKSFPYDLLYKDADRADRYRSRSRWISNGFNTREEAVAYAEARGWIKVSTWKEAAILAKPHVAHLREAEAAKKRAYDQSLITTPELVLAAASALMPGARMSVWVGEDGNLRMKKVV